MLQFGTTKRNGARSILNKSLMTSVTQLQCRKFV